MYSVTRFITKIDFLYSLLVFKGYLKIPAVITAADYNTLLSPVKLTAPMVDLALTYVVTQSRPCTQLTSSPVMFMRGSSKWIPQDSRV